MRTNTNFAGRLLTTTSVAMLTALSCGIAYAQESNGIETVVVTGLKASLDNTIALKKNSTEVIEAVSMEDIGKLPDSSIAESISRLPGLAAQRVNGRAQYLTIRGLSPDFSTTLLNGREQVSTGDDRSVEYDQYPAEVMAGVVVYKTPTADLIGQGLSGTVDMKTIRPLDYGKQVVSISARGETDSLGKLNSDVSQNGYRVSGVYVDQFADGKLGVTIGLAHMDQPTQFEEYDGWGFSTLDDTNISTGAKLFVNSEDLVRTSAIATIQYRPTDNFESTLDLYYSRYRDQTTTRGVQLPLYNQTNVTLDSYTAEDGYASTGSFSDVKVVVQGGGGKKHDDLYSVGWKNEYRSGNWTTTADLNWSSVQRMNTNLTMYAGTGRWGTGDTDTVSFKMNSDNIYTYATSGNVDYNSFDDIKLTGAANWGGYSSSTGLGVHGYQDGYVQYRRVHDYLTNGRLQSKLDMEGDVFKSLTFGFSYTNRHKSLSPVEYYLSLTDSYNQYLEDGTYQDVTVPEKYRAGSADLSKFGFGKVIAFDAFGLLNNPDYYTKISNFSSDVAVKAWQVDEMTYSAFVRGDIDTTLWSIPVDGNVGMQIVATHQSSDAYASNESTYSTSQISSGTNYVDFLPTVNLSFTLDDDNIVRLGVGRQLVRAKMSEMSAATEYSYDSSNASATSLTNSPWSGEGGNPKLKPWRADSIDISYEYYFAKDAYVSLAGYYKYLESYIYEESTLYDFTGFETGDDTTPNLYKGWLTQYQNGNGGSLEGLEFTATIPGHIVTSWLDGFGVTFNASYTDSNIEQDPSDPSTPLPGMSRYVTNATLYYEMGGFSVRLNDSYRSKYIGEIIGYNNSKERDVMGQNWLDGQVSYTFQSGMWNNLSLQFQVENITNENLTAYQNQDEKRVLVWQHYGRKFLFGLTYKM